MNRTLKNVFRVAGIAVGLGAAVWALRDKLLPAPNVPDEPPPRFRTGPTDARATGEEGDDLTEIKGIGPVYASRLPAAGIDTFAALAKADPDAVAAAAKVSEQTAAEWIEQAASHG